MSVGVASSSPEAVVVGGEPDARWSAGTARVMWAKRLGVDADALSKLVESSINGTTAESETLAHQLGFLGPPSTRVPWDALKDQFRQPRVAIAVEKKRMIEELVAERSFTDEDGEVFNGEVGFEKRCQVIWPFRAAGDRGLRRIRIGDLWDCAGRLGEKQNLVRLWHSMAGDWDYNAVLIVSCMSVVHGPSWTKRWCEINAFSDGALGATKVAKRVNDVCKYKMEGEERFSMVEAGGMAGYRTLPFPGFDLVKESGELASGGGDHWTLNLSWDEACAAYLGMAAETVYDVSFDEYVRSGEWVTSGSSSLGRVEMAIVDADGLVTHVKVKARKGSTLDVVTVDELLRHCETDRGQINVVIVKSEPGKVRLAVGGDLITYLRMSWLSKFIGVSYKQWKGSTTKETLVEQTVRISEMIGEAGRCVGLPFDLARFDHQPELTELVGIFRFILSRAISSCPENLLPQYRRQRDIVLNGFSDSVVVLKHNQDTKMWKQTGGLGSGLYWTSLGGNAWNSVMTGLAIRLLRLAGVPTATLKRYIRGDDSSIYGTNWLQLSLLNAAFAAVGAIAAEGKYGITDGMEFLRVWYTALRVYGYPNRVMMGLCFRKPWANTPPDDSGSLAGVYSAVTSLRRRLNGPLNRIDMLWTCVLERWAKLHHIDVRVVSIPRSLGGYGIGPAVYASVKPAMPVIAAEGVTITNLTTYREEKIRAAGVELYGIDIGHEQAHLVAAREASDTVVSSDIPSVTSVLRARWRHNLESERRVVSPHAIDVTRDVGPIVELGAFGAAQMGELLATLQARAPLFGYCPEVELARKDHAIYAPTKPFRAWIKLYFPRIDVSLREFHRSWHISEALDYLAGSQNVPTRVLHPELNKVLQLMIAASCRPGVKAERHWTELRAAQFEPVVWGWAVSQRYYHN